MSDILIGAADNYGWEEIAPWVKSIRATGFKDEVYLILYRVKGDRDALLTKLAEYDVQVYEVNHTPYMTPIEHAQQGSPTQAHNLRFYHAWEVLQRFSAIDTGNVIMTDVRDVVFQRNPSEWLAEKGDVYKRPFIIAPSEGIYYRDEPWNQENLIRGYGQILWDLDAHFWLAHNVGTIAGDVDSIQELCQTIFAMTEGRYYPSDQSSFNVLIHGALEEISHSVGHHSSWACQLGVMGDTTKPHLLEKVCEPLPIIDKTTGMVYNSSNELFVIVHQWDRNADLKPIITARYA